MTDHDMSKDSTAAQELIRAVENEKGVEPIVVGDSGDPLRDLPLSDVFNGKLLAKDWGAVTRFDHKKGKYICYEHGYWFIDEVGLMDRRAKQSFDRIRTEAFRFECGKKAEDLNKHYLRCLQGATIEEAKRRLQSEVPCRMEDFDRDPMLFNVMNGTYELRTGVLREHRPEDMIMNQASFKFEPEAVPPEWPTLVDYWMGGDKQMVEYLRRCMGLFLTGDVRERAFFMLYGTGRNGKGTFVSTIEALLGPYAFALPVEGFLKDGRSNPQQATPDVHAARGKRLIVVGENERGAKFNTGKIRLWTSGGDTMTGRGMRENLSNFRPTHKLLLQTNHEPKLDNSPAMVDRLKKIPFLVRVPDGSQKKELKDYLCENELPGIFNWVVGALPGEVGLRGLAQWRVTGLDTPEPVQQASLDLLQSQDELKEFLEERCAFDVTAELSREDGFKAYRMWCDDRRERRPLGYKSFLAAMREQEQLGIKEGKSGAWRGWIGIQLADSSPSSTTRQPCELCALPATNNRRCVNHQHQLRAEDLPF